VSDDKIRQEWTAQIIEAGGDIRHTGVASVIRSKLYSTSDRVKVSRKEIKRHTGLAVRTITRIVADLIRMGALEAFQSTKADGKRGDTTYVPVWSFLERPYSGEPDTTQRVTVSQDSLPLAHGPRATLGGSPLTLRTPDSFRSTPEKDQEDFERGNQEGPAELESFALAVAIVEVPATLTAEEPMEPLTPDEARDLEARRLRCQKLAMRPTVRQAPPPAPLTPEQQAELSRLEQGRRRALLAAVRRPD
jgi:hypothetical protein